MGDKIKNVLIGTIVFIFLLLFLFHYALNSEKVMAALIKKVVPRYFPDVQISQLKIKRAKFLYPVNLSLGGVSCEFRLNRQAGLLSFDDANFFIKNIFDKQEKNYVFSLDQARLKAQNISVSGFNVFAIAFVDGAQAVTFSAETQIGSLEWDPYLIERIKFNADGDGSIVKIDDFLANLYGGMVAGEGRVHYIRADHPYALALDFQDVDLSELAEVNPGIFSYVRARVNGALEFSGDVQGITALDCNVEAIDGAMMKASLLKQLLDIVSASLGKDLTAMMRTKDNRPVGQALQDLIREDGSVPLTRIKLRSASEGEDKINTFISFESDKFNLNIDSLTIDTRIEGGYKGLLRFLR